jgi:hypothetical protein
MAERIDTKVFVHQLALRMQTDDKVAAAWLEAILETLYDLKDARKLCRSFRLLKKQWLASMI